MMAWSKRSNRRPDTLMQDPSTKSTKTLATHGRTIHWVRNGKAQNEHKFSGLPPKADLPHRGLMERLNPRPLLVGQIRRVALGLLLNFGYPATRRWDPHHKLESRPNLPFNGFSNGL
jgi:hypothetical protein